METVQQKRVTVVLLGLAAAALLPWASPVSAAAAGKAPTEDDYYRIVPLPIPENVVLEVGGLEMMPDGKLAVSSRRGDIYMVSNPDAEVEPADKDADKADIAAAAVPAAAAAAADNKPPAIRKAKPKAKKPRFTLWATGLHEVLGLAYNPKDGFLYACQRAEITRLKDTDKDGKADVYETFCDDWGVSGDYHEYPIMSNFDKDGNLFVVLCLTGSFTSDAPWRGWCLKITPDGKAHPYASGIRSPAGLAFNHLGELFYCDNQGPWNGSSSIKHIVAKSFQGHPIGNRWYDLPDAVAEMGPKPREPQSGSRIYVEMTKIPEYVPPVNYLPHGKVGQAASGITYDGSGGKFGPFHNHLLVADQHHSNITRVVLQKVNGVYQSVAIPFRSGFGSGIVPMIQAPDGSLYVGGTNRGWGSVGPKPFALERLVWTGKTPFELFDMKLTADGFDLTFTEAVDKATAGDVKSYSMSAWTYVFQADYGSPEVDPSTPTVKSATVGEDGKTVHIVVDGLKVGSVHELKLDGVRAARDPNLPLLHPVAWYTLWNLAEAGK